MVWWCFKTVIGRELNMSDSNEDKNSNKTTADAMEVGEATVKCVTINMQILNAAITSTICTIVTIFCATMLLNPKWLIDIICNWVPGLDINLMRFAHKLTCCATYN